MYKAKDIVLIGYPNDLMIVTTANEVLHEVTGNRGYKSFFRNYKDYMSNKIPTLFSRNISTQAIDKKAMKWLLLNVEGVTDMVTNQKN